MLRSEDSKFMIRCLDLAGRAEGMTYPNPVVGSVVVHNGIITGEGYHLKAGGPHAEVFAINSVADRPKLLSSTLYVSLEPCSHFGKTPPCTDLIIKSKIPRVVIGTTDTSSKVSGEGIKRLKEAGCEVITGLFEKECRWINRRFFTFHEKKRPYIILKWAQSADGFIDILRQAGSRAGPNWISGQSERVLVHKWRSEEQAILVGAGTVRTDNPALNVRNWSGNDPLRLILTGSGEIGRYIADNETKRPVISFTGNATANLGNSTKVILMKNTPAAAQISGYLYEKGFQSLIVEGGATVLNHFIENGYWDEARIFRGSREFFSGVQAPVIRGSLLKHSQFESCSLEVIVNEFS